MQKKCHFQQVNDKTSKNNTLKKITDPTAIMEDKDVPDHVKLVSNSEPTNL